MTTPGVVSIVSFGNDPAIIEEREIESIRLILQSGFRPKPFPFLREGTRVRVSRGALEGLEGVLVKGASDWRVVISVFMLQRSLSVVIDQESITPLSL